MTPTDLDKIEYVRSKVKQLLDCACQSYATNTKAANFERTKIDRARISSFTLVLSLLDEAERWDESR